MKIVADQSAAFDRKKGHDVFQTILQGQPKIDGVFGVNDEMAIGAAQAAVEANRRKGIRFWGADGELDMFKGIKSGLVDGVSAIAANAVPDTVMNLGAWLMTAGVKGGMYAGRIELPPYIVTSREYRLGAVAGRLAARLKSDGGGRAASAAPRRTQPMSVARARRRARPRLPGRELRVSRSRWSC